MLITRARTRSDSRVRAFGRAAACQWVTTYQAIPPTTSAMRTYRHADGGPPSSISDESYSRLGRNGMTSILAELDDSAAPALQRKKKRDGPANAGQSRVASTASPH